MKLSNAKDEIITTIAGIIFLMVPVFLLVIDVFKETYEVDWKILLGSGLLGIGLILAPDDLYFGAIGIVKKQVDKDGKK